MSKHISGCAPSTRNPDCKVCASKALRSKSIRRKDAVKNTKRILEVKIVRKVDTDPDTSYYGEYSNTPNSEFSIDRATDEFQGDIDAGREWLDRIQSRIENEQTACEEHIYTFDETCSICEQEKISQNALDTIQELKESEPFANVSWNSNEFRYFNPSDNYQGESAEDIRKYVRQDFERMEGYNRQEWEYVGIYAVAKVQLSRQINQGCVPGHEVYNTTTQTIRSGGLWGTESDSDRSEFEEIEKEQLSELRDSLKMLGFSTRAISAAFKNVRGVE